MIFFNNIVLVALRLYIFKNCTTIINILVTQLILHDVFDGDVYSSNSPLPTIEL